MDLVFEYARIGYHAHGWSAHFKDLLHSVGIEIPYVLTRSPFDFDPVKGEFFATGAYLDLLAIAITVFITVILVKGIRESAGFNTAMVIVKLAIVFFVIIVGMFYIDPKNWAPFAPYGYSGGALSSHTFFRLARKRLLRGRRRAAIIFFGFDSVSTHAKKLQRSRTVMCR